MSFFETLQHETDEERRQLLARPIIGRCLANEMTLDDYVAFLCQAYHHVRHTVPLLMALGSRLRADQEWLRDAVAEYIDEEKGHQEWILNDIGACGFDKEKARHSQANFATELMVAYAYYTIDRTNPLGFFGMVHVLEGTSISVADAAAEALRSNLHLPASAFSYLKSHGALDQEHVAFFHKLMDQIDQEQDRRDIIHCARRFYRLYGAVLDSIAPHQALSLVA